ncbi:hypothetical protein A2U01_0001488 [Trifolium medium]|uniref:Uncharacterized protein n=1 Tax=Trifolium medium TaxID=97028 RepID=A0A392M0F0_9FABA|nr:hypothetical protein [Trifolium medium]
MRGDLNGIFSSVRRVVSHRTSAVTKARMRYSASVLERATTVCFLDHHERRFGPMKIAAPEVERRSSGSDSQSASLFTNRREGFMKVKPMMLMKPFCHKPRLILVYSPICILLHSKHPFAPNSLPVLKKRDKGPGSMLVRKTEGCSLGGEARDDEELDKEGEGRLTRFGEERMVSCEAKEVKELGDEVVDGVKGNSLLLQDAIWQ